MKAYFFSETAYPHLPEPENYNSIRVTLPNRYYDPKIGADLYHRHIDEWLYAEDLGWDIMINEHHQTATNVDPAAPIMLGVLARLTTKAKLLILGNPIVNRTQPVRVAEEMAMVDLLSRGRIEVGFVRGVPYEMSAANSSPVRMQERFWEAHDLILKAWTTHDGPFNWEGRYFHHRQVNIWPRPYQQPRPPVWVTATSPGSVKPVAEHGHVVATFLTGYEQTKQVFGAYRKTDAEMGRETNSDRLAYAALVYVGDTDEEGFAGARKLLWYIYSNKVPTQFSNPPGYMPVESVAKILRNGGRSPYHFENKSLEELIEMGIVFAGNPDTVYKQTRKFYDYVGGFGRLLVMGQAGFLDRQETMKGIRVFAQEVYPRLQELK
jgi:alkanesulfonate monooxygenase SsuD/methylene tetrahydromethanopterin reductase-like flavin-dependent oxidoreductase (luciferase family)